MSREIARLSASRRRASSASERRQSPADSRPAPCAWSPIRSKARPRSTAIGIGVAPSAGRLVEIGSAPCGSPICDHRRAHAGLGCRLRWADLLGAAEEADRRLRIAELERGPAGADQRVEVPRVEREHADIARQRRFRRLDGSGSGASGGGGAAPIYCAAAGTAGSKTADTTSAARLARRGKLLSMKRPCPHQLAQS